MLKSKKLSKFKRAVSAVTVVMLTISCLGVNYDVSAMGEPTTTEVPQNNNDNYDFVGDVSLFPGAFETVGVKTSNISLVEGTTTTIEIPSDTSGGDISCTSSDPSVATVNEQGVVTAYKAGSAKLSYHFKKTTGNQQTGFRTDSFGHIVNVTVTPATVEATRNLRRVRHSRSARQFLPQTQLTRP